MDQQQSFNRGMKALVGLGLGAFGLVAAMDGFRAYQTQGDFKFTDQSVTVPAGQAALKFGPYQEDARTVITVPRAPAGRDYLPTSLPQDLSNNFAMLRQNKAALDSALDQCASRRCPSELRNYLQVIADIRQVPDRRAQLALVNGWVNTAILYDNNEVAARSQALNQNKVVANSRPRTLAETLRDGKGICDEQTQLKLHMLDRLGFPQRDLRYAALMLTMRPAQNPGKAEFSESHAVVLARVGGDTYVLNNQNLPGWSVVAQAGQILQRAQYKPEANFMAIVVRPENLTNVGWDMMRHNDGVRAFPLQAINYQQAALYAGVQYRDKPPFYIGQKFTTPLLRAEPLDLTLGENLEQVPAPARPIAERVLANGINYHSLVATDPRYTMIIRGKSGPGLE